MSHCSEPHQSRKCFTFYLQMDKRKDPSSVDVKQVLLEMRKYRMGLIQTADQLRFSYLAVIEGAKFIMGDASVQVSAPGSSQGAAASGWEEQDGKELQIWCLLQLQYMFI